jgi:hypothetical protein
MSTQETQNQSGVAQHSAAMLANLKNRSRAKVEPKCYQANMLSVRYVFKDGKTASFLTDDGITCKYTTNIACEIAELDEEIENMHPHITHAAVTPKAAAVEPIEALKARHFEEFKKLMASSTLKTNDAGNSDQGKLNVANSTTVAEGAAGSDASSAPAVGGLKISIGAAK